MTDKILRHPADGSLSPTEKTEIVRGETGWFLISEESPERWANVSGPFPTDEVAVQAGYQIAGLVRGHPYRAVSLVPALRQALDHPERFRVEEFEESSVPALGGGVR